VFIFIFIFILPVDDKMLRILWQRMGRISSWPHHFNHGWCHTLQYCHTIFSFYSYIPITSTVWTDYVKLL